MGIFDATTTLFQRYRARIQFRDKLMGGVPRDPKLIEAWLRAKAGISDTEELRQAMIRTLIESGAEVRTDMSYDELANAIEAVASTRETTGFKRDERGLYIESRQVKAGLKECVNILYGGQRVGPTRKGAKSFFAERVFVSPDHLHLGRHDPDDVEMVIGHVSGPTGQRSTLGYHEQVTGACVEFDVLVSEDAIESEWWPRLWVLYQENGLGALRSQGFGRFDIIAWDRVSLTDAGNSG